MHRIDGPGATVDNRFTDGDPVGGIQATMVTDDWANDVQEELMSVLAAAAIAPVKGTQDQLLRSIRTLSAGIVGAARNVKMSVATANANATITAEEVIVKSALGGAARLLNNFSKAINLAGTGIGGMLSGSAPVNGYVAIYSASKDDGTQGAFAIDATSALAPQVAASAPAGYTATALISVWPTNGSGQFIAGMQVDRNISIVGATVLNTSSVVVTPITLSLAAVVPKNARFVSGVLIINALSSGTLGLSIYASDSPVGEQGIVVNGTGLRVPFSRVAMVTAQTVRWSSSSAVASPTFQIIVTSYDF
ncbi:MAG: hypothetical protein Q7K57_31250 [Burkholderiaceae bacterium]|uniref:hypothetical protein n=1 Tax=Pseudomonas mandelii TaxID=75612 RepID=UPI001C83EEA8|nr:hypothetical protein [Pseudomonas mandelii]MDO8773105.1 hypothetical protein [Burkholderiaceae bacterium]QZA96129.1 hypothetical protein K3369_20485 [Pseudomonas mandelii]